ncbi:hypothetical protein Tdes44962_MAKER03448 [Teratosphaeria destructans]|uniref:SRR1-like domain-containing protein n=1 Tax=Teratosphaeria destructans TaxID=418781 RepID=A0A9W7SQ43_9PEZI|nr:hypothetical protein Tdes44962_MAKER03448 [Teratosphaeria destructans]
MILKHLDDHKPAQGETSRKRSAWRSKVPRRTSVILAVESSSTISSSISKRRLGVYVQDPDFSSLDRELCEALGIKTIRDSEAQAMTDDSPFTYVPYWGHDADLLRRGPRSTPRVHLGAGVSFLIRKELGFQGYEYEVDLSHYVGESDWWPDFRELEAQHEMGPGCSEVSGAARVPPTP